MIRTTVRLAAGLAATLALALGGSTACSGRAAAAVPDPLIAQVARAAPGATLVVPAGVHHVHLVLTRPLTLTGAAGAVLDGDGSGSVLRIVAAHVTVSHLAVRNSGRDLTAMDAGIFVEQTARGVRILDNDISESLFGMWLNGPPDALVQDNRVRGFADLPTVHRGDGIHLWNVHSSTVAGNTVSFSRDGIYVYVSNHDRISGNHVSDVRYGVHYMYSNDNVLDGNHTTRTRGGYALMQSERLLIENNVSDRDSNYGLLMNFILHSTIRGNRVTRVAPEQGYVVGGNAVSGGDGKGLFAYNCVHNTITGNLFADNGIGVHLTAGSTDNRFYGNAFVNNHVQVRYGNTRQEEWSWQGRGNYWSGYLGWDLNGDGIGDVPFVPNDAMDRLLWIYPNVRLLMNSPAVATLRWVQALFPVFDMPHVQDSHPLMTSPFSASAGSP
ncbi:periplasmic copper-binding protein (NosD) [mine drainage metagenome]|uniref:Periplasmic copper-binding protein (NosD) n=1 Tax=mine drainage metagenome TaxID=410659 RepID=A0A1J5RDW4_9ZZZZ